MSGLPLTAESAQALDRAGRLAQETGHRMVTPSHLLLAIMSQPGSPWPERIVERGGLSYRLALRRLRWQPRDKPQRTAQAKTGQYRASMRLMVVVLVMTTAMLVASVFRLTRRGQAADARPNPPRDSDTAEAIALGERFALAGATSGAARPAELEVAHLLLALATTPGQHLKVLENSTVLSCAIRAELGLATSRHRLILACDRAKLAARRAHMRIDREISSRGHWSSWGIAWAGYGAAGLLFAAAVFPFMALANFLLYLFLWPAAMLVAGLRAFCGMVAGYDARSYRWLKIPGGDVALSGAGQRMSARSVAIALLVPRLVAFLCCVAALVAILWRSERLGIVASPTLFRRPDLISGAAHESIWLTSASILEGMLIQNGTLAGIGLLAGLGAGMMSLPTYRELELIRLYAGHEAGRGSGLARSITAPASMLTGAISCVEAVLPFSNGPIYLTVYIVPLTISLFLAAAIVAILPY